MILCKRRTMRVTNPMPKGQALLAQSLLAMMLIGPKRAQKTKKKMRNPKKRPAKTLVAAGLLVAISCSYPHPVHNL